MTWRSLVLAFMLVLLDSPLVLCLRSETDVDISNHKNDSVFPSSVFTEDDVLVFSEEEASAIENTKWANDTWWRRAGETSVAEKESAKWFLIPVAVHVACSLHQRHIGREIERMKGQLEYLLEHEMPALDKRMFDSNGTDMDAARKHEADERRIERYQNRINELENKLTTWWMPCNWVKNLIYGVATIIKNHMCVIVQGGLAAFAMLGDYAVQAAITAGSGGAAGAWIASMKAMPFCMNNVKPPVGTAFRRGSSLTSKAFEEASSFSNQITLSAKAQLTTASVLSKLNALVSTVARKLCELVDRATSSVRDAIKRNTNGLINFDTCDAVPHAVGLVSIVLNAMCGNFVSALMVIVTPLVMCNIEDFNGNKCQQQGCLR